MKRRHYLDCTVIWAMAYRPRNLTLRFILELTALASLAVWGWLSNGWIAALGAPLLAFALWGIFAVPGDPSRSGQVPVPIPGWLRLALELAIFYGAVGALLAIDQSAFAIALCAITILHHGLSYNRLAWLLRR